MRHALCVSFAWLALGTAVHAQDNLITKDARQAIDAGLAYLEKEQAKDGSWGAGNYKGSVAVTSLAGLAFLSGNHAPDRGDFGKAVTKAIRYVLKAEDKDTAGFFQTPTATHGPMYDHGFAVLFLAPDLFMLGYLVGVRIGAACYNFVHTYLTPAALIAICFLTAKPLLPFATIWICHICFDRMLGFGLKYPTRFNDTHLHHV